MMDRLTPGQEKQVRAIVAEMIGAALQGADHRLRYIAGAGVDPSPAESLSAIAVDLVLAPVERVLGDCCGCDQPIESAPRTQREGLR